MFDFLLENMEGKFIDFFFLLEIFGSFDKEILGLELTVLSTKIVASSKIVILKFYYFSLLSNLLHHKL